MTKYSTILGVFQQPWPGVSPTAILNEEKALGTRLHQGGPPRSKATKNNTLKLKLLWNKIILCTSRCTIYFQQPDMKLCIYHEVKSKQLKTLISKTFCRQFLQQKTDKTKSPQPGKPRRITSHPCMR